MNGTNTDPLAALSDLLLELHKLPEQVDFARFQKEALELLARAMQFDAAWWGLMSGLDVHTEYLHNISKDFSSSWEALKDSDPIAAEAGRKPSLTVYFDGKAIAKHPALMRLLEHHDVRHVLCTHQYDKKLNLHAFLSLYRASKEFTETERMLKQVVMPHLIHALHLSWRKHLERIIIEGRETRFVLANAVVDRRGLILSAEDYFGRLMSFEWPRWSGPMLPAELIKSLGSGRGFQGRKIRFQSFGASELYLLQVSERLFLTELSDREMMVAELYASGQTYKVIAQKLNLAPATVRHYIRTIFAKLQIGNKAALAKALFATRR